MGSNPSRDASKIEPLASKSSQNCELFTEQILESFLKSRATGTSPRTIRLYHIALDGFIGYPLTPEGINRYLKSLTCGNGKHNYYRCLRTLCRWLYLTDLLGNNPIEKILPPRRQKRLLPAISKEQLDILVQHAPTERDKVVLNLLWYSGMRLSEAAGVKVKDFNWNEGTVIVAR